MGGLDQYHGRQKGDRRKQVDREYASIQETFRMLLRFASRKHPTPRILSSAGSTSAGPKFSLRVGYHRRDTGNLENEENKMND